VRAGLALLACALAALWTPPARAQFFGGFFNPPPSPRAAAPHREFRQKPHKRARPAPEKKRRPAVANTESLKAPAPAPEGPPPAFEPQLLRLSEIMGALAVLDPLCGDSGRSDWRETMQKLMDAQESGPMQRERLAGAYNRGLRGYAYFHRRCTANADLARVRLLEEGGRLAHDIGATYRER